MSFSCWNKISHTSKFYSFCKSRDFVYTEGQYWGLRPPYTHSWNTNASYNSFIFLVEGAQVWLVHTFSVQVDFALLVLIVKGSLTAAFQRKSLLCSLALLSPCLVVAGGYKIYLNFGEPYNLHWLITHSQTLTEVL